MVTRGEVGGGVGEKAVDEEGTYPDEHWVMSGGAESLYCTPKTSITLYVNYTGIEIKSVIKNK